MAPFLGQSVIKHGRSTGLTFGSVVDTSFDGVVRYDDSVAYFEDQVVVTGDDGPFSEPGDSGSVILDTTSPHPIGHLFAGDDSQTVANPLRLSSIASVQSPSHDRHSTSQTLPRT